MKILWCTAVMAACLFAGVGAWAQQEPPLPPPGKVVVSSDRLPEAPVSESSSSVLANQQAPPDVPPKPAMTDAERSAIVITAWDLDVHLVPSEASEEVRARLTLRNAGTETMRRIALQISSTLRWQSVHTATGAVLPLTQSPMATDADHTGYAQELVATLDMPLAPGASMQCIVTYNGLIVQSGARLELLGNAPERAATADWDAIVPTSDAASTALRGFGDVLWYPVAAPVALLGDGNKLVEQVARQRTLGNAATMRLRLTVETVGDPPNAAIFNGHLEELTIHSDEQDLLVGEARGVATAEFPAASLGFRVPNLFLTAQKAQTSGDQALTFISSHSESVEPYRAAIALVQPMLTEWFGPAPVTPLLLLDHAGEPYSDAAFVAAQLTSSAKPESIAPTLTGALAHAWFHIGGAANTWLDQGMAEFMSLLWLERTQGRAAAIQQVQHAALLIGLAEPDMTATPASAGQPLIAATSDIYLRLKAATVLWQLREILGEPLLREAVLVFRHSLTRSPELAQDAHAFERSIEHTAGRELDWFFNDWVYRDRSLPDLTVMQVNPRELPARPGKNAGYLVAVEVRNDGEAAADVPVTVRAGTLTATERLRIPGRASVSTRVLFESTPETVEVNDGSVPELRTSTHTTKVQVVPHT